jgi:7,8-dihydroneopterin 2',3'-cyclic phosphate phosphodiesterase
MAELKDLLTLAERIKDKDLREKTLAFLKDPKVSNPHMGKKYKKAKWEQSVSGPESFHHGYPGGLIDHTISVTNLCISTAEALMKSYDKLKVDMDTLIASALLHDAIKPFEWKTGKHGVEHTGSSIDHTVWGTAELYSQGFPEEILHCVASHGGDIGTTKPESVEAKILHHCDNFDAMLEHSSHGGSGGQIVFLTPEDLGLA